MTRTVPFGSVFESVLRRMGYDPFGDAVKQDVQWNVLTHINDRVRFAWPIHEWPELNAIEWRAFRQIWTPSVTFLAGQDVYYLGDGVTVPAATADLPSNYPGPNAGYYQVIANPPVSTPPTNATYFTLYGGSTLPALSDRYIQYSQPGQNVIGDLLDGYPENPRETRWTRILRQAPSSKGIDFKATGLDIIWIRYRVPVSVFTIDQFQPGYTVLGSSFYDPVGKDCYNYTGEVTLGLGPSGTTHGGTLIPMPAFLSGYVRAAAYADTILETTMEAKVRLMLSQVAGQEALEYLQREIDNLAAQGQVLYYKPFQGRRRHFGGPRVSDSAIGFEVFKGFN